MGGLVNMSLILYICLFSVLVISGAEAISLPWTTNSNFEKMYMKNFAPKEYTSKNQTRAPTYRMHGELMDTCYIANDCRSFAYQCSERNTCECAEGYLPDEKRETCVGGIDSKCMYDSHCISRAYCKGQLTCACKLEFPIVSSDKWTCKGSGSQPPSILNRTLLLSMIVGCFWSLSHHYYN